MLHEVGANFAVVKTLAEAQPVGFAQKLITPKAFANFSPGLLQPWGNIEFLQVNSVRVR